MERRKEKRKEEKKKIGKNKKFKLKRGRNYYEKPKILEMGNVLELTAGGVAGSGDFEIVMHP